MLNAACLDLHTGGAQNVMSVHMHKVMRCMSSCNGSSLFGTLICVSLRLDM